MSDKKNFPLIAAVVFAVLGGLLLLSTMDDPPGPPRIVPVRPSGFKTEMLEDNRSDSAQLFIKTCTQCHDLPDPKSHTKEEWPAVVDRMINQLRRRRFFSSKSLFVPEKKKVDEITSFLSLYAANP